MTKYFRRKGSLWLTISEITTWFTCSVSLGHGGKAWRRKPAQFMAARKKREGKGDERRGWGQGIVLKNPKDPCHSSKFQFLSFLPTLSNSFKLWIYQKINPLMRLESPWFNHFYKAPPLKNAVLLHLVWSLQYMSLWGGLFSSKPSCFLPDPQKLMDITQFTLQSVNPQESP